MSRPRSAHTGPKKYYLGNKPQEQYKFMIPPESLPNIQNIQYNAQSSNDIFDDEYKDELNLIKNSWEDLGISHEYRVIFINFIQKVNSKERKGILMQEKINLKKFRDALLSLKKEIDNRENNIALLKRADNNLETAINVENKTTLIDRILQDVIGLIKTLRLNAINIVAKTLKVNKLLSYYSDSGKFNINKIRMEYLYDPNYLSKMKDDLFFLKNSVLSYYIEMNNTEIDPFLTNCAPTQNKKKNNLNEKITIPISDDIMKLITESRYALLQENVISNINKNDNVISRKFDFNDGNLNINKYGSLEEDKYRFNINGPYLNNNYKNNDVKINNYFKKKNMSRYLHEIKNAKGPSKYNSLFVKNNSLSGNKLRAGKRKIFNNNYPLYNNNNAGKKIIIEHELVQSLTNEEFLKKLNQYKLTQDNINNLNREDDIINNDEMENLKKENYNYIEENQELKQINENLEQKLKNEEEMREKLQNKYKELYQRTKEYQTELEKTSKNKKKIEYELNNKIKQLEKEKDENDEKFKYNNEEKERYEKEKKEMKIKEDELNEKIKNLEKNLKNEENERIKKEKEIEDLENKLNEEKEEREKEKE